MSIRSLPIVVIAVALLVPAAHAGLPPNLKCAFAKQKAALKKLKAINACYRKATELGTQPDPACFAAAEQKFQDAFVKIEAKGGCMPETGDADGVETVIDRCAANLAQLLSGVCQPAGAICGGTAPPCCTGLVCAGSLGQSPTCG